MPAFRNISIGGSADDMADSQVRLKSLLRSEHDGHSSEFRRRGAVLQDEPATGIDGSESDLDAGSSGSFPEPIRERLSELSDESASRLFLQAYMEDSGDDALHAATAPHRPELVPDMNLRAISDAPALNARSVTYQQSSSNIPIFGGRVVVDIDASNKALVSINGKVAPVPDKPAIADISAQRAWELLVKWSGSQSASPPTPPVLTWYLDDNTWRLVHHFESAPFSPPGVTADHDDAHACVRACSLASDAEYDYFVDAHSGEVVFYFSSAPNLDIPSPMSGLDCFSVPQQFFGLNGGTGYLLVDPLRNIETYDYGFQNIALKPTPPFPAKPIMNASNDLGATSPQAVSAHYHARLVFDFFNDELKRAGIDGKGMKLISVVNVYSSNRNPLPAPQWGNAAWWQSKMWYGEENGQSFAKHLDIIAHELTHGVTETSSNLIYRDLPGALNESYSDIFGVIIANWFPARPNPLIGWKWEIGAGLRSDGGPLRNFADPAAAGQPDHMSKYVKIANDNGGVHIYSGIHNKAVHQLLTATDSAGGPLFPIRDLVLLLYYTLIRLTQLSDFSDSRRTLKTVAGIYYKDAPTPIQTARLAAIDAAFDSVGIT